MSMHTRVYEGVDIAMNRLEQSYREVPKLVLSKFGPCHRVAVWGREATER